MIEVFFSLIKRIRKFISWLWNQKGLPSQRALGLAVGIFSGCFPFFGFQTLVGIFFAKIWKANALLAAVGTWISNPFTYVPLYLLNYRNEQNLLYDLFSLVVELSYFHNLRFHKMEIFSQAMLCETKQILNLILNLLYKMNFQNNFVIVTCKAL